MKIQEFLTEDPSISFSTAIKTVKSECKNFLSQANGQLMFMGVKNGGTFNLNFLPHSKLPSKASEEFNFMFTAGMKMAFNVDNRDSFFCGDVLSAMSTGDANFCFPKGKFNFIYSKNFYDSAVEAQRLYKLLANYLHIKGADSELVVKQMFQTMSGEMTLTKFLSDEESKLWMQVFKMPARRVKHAMKMAFEQMYVHNEKLEDALRAGCEVIIYQSEGCYTIPWNRVVGQMMGEGIKVRSHKKFGNLQVTNYLKRQFA